MTHIEVISDYLCPWCYVGKMRLYRLLKEENVQNVSIGISPFLLYADLPLNGLPKSQLNNKFKSVPSKLREEAEEESIELNFNKSSHVPNTILAHVATELVDAEYQSELNTRIFEAYFRDGIDIGSIDNIASLTCDYNITKEHIHENSQVVETKVIETSSQHKVNGINAVPSYRINSNSQAISGVLPSQMWRNYLQRIK